MDESASPEGRRMLADVTNQLTKSESDSTPFPPGTVHWTWPRKPVGPSKGGKGFPKLGVKASAHPVKHSHTRSRSRGKKAYGWD